MDSLVKSCQSVGSQRLTLFRVPQVHHKTRIRFELVRTYLLRFLLTLEKRHGDHCFAIL
jgi:hypothetical protein